METNPQKQTVVIKYSDSQPTKGEVDVQSQNKNQRLKACIKVWVLCWVLAIFSILVPIGHFILVPTFLILGPTLGLIKYGQKGNILGGKGVCPACKAELKIEKGNLKWPLEELCTSCRRTVRIEPS